MQLQSMSSSQDGLRSGDETSNRHYKEERRRTGRYIAGGAALTIILIGVYHVFARGATTIAGICVPAFLMACYILWVLYAARRDRIKAMRLASAVHLAEVNDGSSITDNASVSVNQQKSSIAVVGLKNDVGSIQTRSIL